MIAYYHIEGIRYFSPPGAISRLAAESRSIWWVHFAARKINREIMAIPGTALSPSARSQREQGIHLEAINMKRSSLKFLVSNGKNVMSLRYDLLMSWWCRLRVSVTRSQHKTGLCTDQFHWNLDAANAQSLFENTIRLPKEMQADKCRFTANHHAKQWSHAVKGKFKLFFCHFRFLKISSFLPPHGWPQGRWLPRWFGARYRTWEAKVSVGNWRGTLT